MMRGWKTSMCKGGGGAEEFSPLNNLPKMMKNEKGPKM